MYYNHYPAYIVSCNGMVKSSATANNMKRKNQMELLKIILAIVLPPLGVFFQVGIGKHFWINIVLTILGYIPGIVHAIWVIAKNK